MFYVDYRREAMAVSMERFEEEGSCQENESTDVF